jgi:uncharacterized protein (TIGR04255 family)
MASNLGFDDFSLVNVTCELRYPNAYMIYDHTGEIAQDLRDHFSDLVVATATPPQTDFIVAEGGLTLGLAASRVTCTPPHSKPESFAKHCKSFFDVVLDRLDIDVLTRIGLRPILRKDFKSLDEARTAMASAGLVNLNPPKRFNSSHEPTELVLRWQDSNMGAAVRLKTDTIEIKFVPPAEVREWITSVDKTLYALTLDIDYYTVAPVEREQWHPEEWVVEKLRVIKKESDGILQGGGK